MTNRLRVALGKTSEANKDWAAMGCYLPSYPVRAMSGRVGIKPLWSYTEKTIVY